MIQKIIFLSAIISTSCVMNLYASDNVQEDDVKSIKMAKISSLSNLDEKETNLNRHKKIKTKNILSKYQPKKVIKKQIRLRDIKILYYRNLIKNTLDDPQKNLEAKYKLAEYLSQNYDNDPGHQRKLEFTKLIQGLKSENHLQAFSLHNKLTLNSEEIKQVKKIENGSKSTEDYSQDEEIVVDDEFVDF